MAASVIVLYGIQGQSHQLQVHKTHPENHNPFTFLHLPAGWGTTPPSWTSNYRLRLIWARKEKKDGETRRYSRPTQRTGLRRGKGREAAAPPWLGAPGGKGKEASQGTTICIRQMQATKGRVRAPRPCAAALTAPGHPDLPTLPAVPTPPPLHFPGPIPPVEPPPFPLPNSCVHQQPPPPPPHYGIHPAPPPSRSPPRLPPPLPWQTAASDRRTELRRRKPPLTWGREWVSAGRGQRGAAGAVSSWGRRWGRRSRAARGGGKRRVRPSPSRFAASTEAGRPPHPATRKEAGRVREGGKEEGGEKRGGRKEKGRAGKKERSDALPTAPLPHWQDRGAPRPNPPLQGEERRSRQ